METIKTPLTELFGIKYPIILAGMNKAAGPKLAAAVSNAGGLGVIGGVNYTPRMLRGKIKQIKKHLDNPNLPFGVDLLLPQVGGSARKTNYDYTKGHLDELADIIIAEKASLFVSAVGVPPKRIVDKFHAAGIPCMNMIGSVRHVPKCLAVGIDLICAQGGEGGGHTGEVATTVLLPAVVDLVRKSGAKSPLNGEPVRVVGAGGISDGRTLASVLCMGADAAWIGTRFVCATEAGASKDHKDAVIKTTAEGTIRTLIFTGRPMRVAKNPYIMHWENNRQQELKSLCAKGVLPYMADMQKAEKGGKSSSQGAAKMLTKWSPHLMGQVAGNINEIKPAKEIMHDMMTEAIQTLRQRSRAISNL